MSCYLWELEALLEGLALRRLDEQEQHAVFAFNLRYVLNAKKPKLTKIFDKKKAEKKIRDLFAREVSTNNRKQLANQVRTVANHFKNKTWR